MTQAVYDDTKATCVACGMYLDMVRSGKHQHNGPCVGDIRSVHVILQPWCLCCQARVSVDHLCGCEEEYEE